MGNGHGPSYQTAKAENPAVTAKAALNQMTESLSQTPDRIKSEVTTCNLNTNTNMTSPNMLISSEGRSLWYVRPNQLVIYLIS